MVKVSSLIPTVVLVMAFLYGHMLQAQDHAAKNPIIHADVPDMSMIRVGDTYYMSSTTMHMNPGVPIMKSKDLVNWELVGYAYDTLGEAEDLSLENGKDMYGKGSWASSLRYHDGTYYVSTFSGNTGKTYIYTTKDIEKGPWKAYSFSPSLHDHTLFFEEDKIYMIWGGGELRMVELKEDLSGIKEGTEKVLIENATAPSGPNVMLPAEGSQLFKVDGQYYLFNISWPRGGMRTVIVHRADKIIGPYEGKVMLQDKGVAQGGLIDTPKGEWYAYLFRDNGAVGRIPYLVPVEWKDGWPVLGIEGKVPETLVGLPASKGLIPGIVASDDFNREAGDESFPLVWQWNHNPDPAHWSLQAHEGWWRITTSRVDSHFLSAKNTLTQRTIGPESTGTTKMDVSGMKEGDFAGLGLLQKEYGLVGVKINNGQKIITMVNTNSGEAKAIEEVSMHQEIVCFKAECDFKERKDQTRFFYSLDGKEWKTIGDVLNMKYTLPHFMGYRFALFNYATKNPGGHVDFDYFHIKDKIGD